MRKWARGCATREDPVNSVLLSSYVGKIKNGEKKTRSLAVCRLVCAPRYRRRPVGWVGGCWGRRDDDDDDANARMRRKTSSTKVLWRTTSCASIQRQKFTLAAAADTFIFYFLRVIFEFFIPFSPWIRYDFSDVSRRVLLYTYTRIIQWGLSKK